MFERTKSLFGIGAREKRYSDPEEDFEEPQNIENPHTTTDSTSMSLGEFVTRNSGSILGFSVLLVVGLVILAVYFGRYFVTTLSNPWVQRGLAGLAVLMLGYFYGRSAQRSALLDRDELILYNAETGEVTQFLGEFKKAGEGDHPLFVPIKGFSAWGHSAQHYTIGELSRELAAATNRSPDEEVVIRLHPSVSATAVTNTGRKTAQLSAGMEPDPFGRESNVEAALPALAPEDTLDELTNELEATYLEKEQAEKKNTMLRRQRNDAVKEAQKSREELREEFGETMEMIYPFTSGRAGRQTNGQGDEYDLEAARESLTHDNER